MPHPCCISGSSDALLREGLWQRRSAGYAEGLAIDVACLLGGQEDIGGGELYRLGGASHRRLLLTKLGDELGGQGGRNERGPHRTRGHNVYPNALLGDLHGEPFGEVHYGRFCGSVVEQDRLGLVGLDGGGVDDARARLHVR
jgi:hypothetical protein